MKKLTDYTAQELFDAYEQKLHEDATKPIKEGFLKENWYRACLPKLFHNEQIPESELEIKTKIKIEKTLDKGTRFTYYNNQGWFEDEGWFESMPDSWAEKHLENIKNLK